MLHGGPYQKTYDDQLPVRGFYQFALDRGYAVLRVNYRGTYGYGRDYVRRGFFQGLDGPSEDARALRDAAFKALGMTNGRTILAGESFGGYLVVKALVDGDRWFDAALIEEGVCNWTMRPDKIMGKGLFSLGGYVPIENFVDLDPILYSVKLFSDRIGSHRDGNYCGRPIRRDVPVLMVQSADDRIAPFADMEAFETVQTRLGRRVKILKAIGIGHLDLLEQLAEYKSSDSRKAYQFVFSYLE